MYWELIGNLMWGKQEGSRVLENGVGGAKSEPLLHSCMFITTGDS